MVDGRLIGHESGITLLCGVERFPQQPSIRPSFRPALTEIPHMPTRREHGVQSNRALALFGLLDEWLTVYIPRTIITITGFNMGSNQAHHVGTAFSSSISENLQSYINCQIQCSSGDSNRVLYPVWEPLSY
ncbi:hypothetical protein J6590_086502 [Homalodisca vitripennis]|nr:hypothetical protein J6590_086502 [Homalodisca vitripennis]